jgi:hypothetical protein
MESTLQKPTDLRMSRSKGIVIGFVTAQALIPPTAPLQPDSSGFPAGQDRGRKSRLASAPPPSEPDRRVSRIRLSGWWSYLRED